MKKKEVDFMLSVLVLFLLGFGVVMISSVSVFSSYLTTSNQVARWLLDEANNSFFWIKTIWNVIIGILCMIVFAKIPYTLIERYVFYIYSFSVISLVAVLFFGSTYKGAKWWIDIPGLPSIQPVELVKIGLIIMLAFFIKKRHLVMGRFKEWFMNYFAYVSVVLWLLVLQPDFWSVLIIALFSLTMYFAGGGNKKFLMYGFLGALVLAMAVYFTGKIFIPNEEGRNKNPVAYISTRIDNFFRDELDIAQTQDKSGSDYQLKQGFIAMWSGWFFGLGFWNSIQKYWYLPEVQGDFIFSVIIEEFWFIGGLILFLLYMAIAYRGLLIARSVKDLFGKFLAFGIISWFIIQTFINIGVNMNVVPLTGVTLPFVSYGGTSVLSLCIATGILLSISRHAEYRPQSLSEALQVRRNIHL